MCVVVKQEWDKITATTTTTTTTIPLFGGVEVPMKVNSLEIPEAEIPAAGPVVGFTQPEINAALNLLRDYPKATTEVEKQNVLVSLDHGNNV